MKIYSHTAIRLSINMKRYSHTAIRLSLNMKRYSHTATRFSLNMKRYSHSYKVFLHTRVGDSRCVSKWYTTYVGDHFSEVMTQ